MAQFATVERIAESQLPTQFGRFRAIAYRDTCSDKEHLALLSPEQTNTPLVRLHSECLTGDSLNSLRCDCGEQLQAAQQMIQTEGGALLYLRQEGRGIGLANKIKAYALQDSGMDTMEANLHLGFGADDRDYGVAAAILLDLGMQKVRLLTNNPQKITGITNYGVSVVERVGLEIRPNPHNDKYLRTKRDRMDHQLPNLNGNI